ncbi:hypothetical protein [Streptomyces hygroscopicus]|uniref:hypothetical protein n=1 Tax=Streptomyces hygroscopicus TaxID=1912 RepID=UPI0007806C84|nr:hypothetical protein [Streptomyces hygroscopicus]
MTDLSAAKLARLAVEALPTDGKVVFTAPKYADRGTAEVAWAPETALAVAGHICQHWGIGVSTRRLIVERYRGFVVTLRYEVWHGTYRLNVAELEDGPQVAELCGRIDCTDPAPAGPSSRCSRHFGDPVPDSQQDTHWAQIAAEAWRAKYPTAGEEKVLLDNARNALVVGALAAGMRPMDLHRAMGIARTTIDRIDAPQPDPEWDGHPLDGPA